MVLSVPLYFNYLKETSEKYYIFLHIWKHIETNVEQPLHTINILK